MPATYQQVSERIRKFDERDLGQGAKIHEIEDAERSLDLKIKGEFRSFIEEFGWGGVGHIDIYGLGDDTPQHLSIVRVTQSERTEMIPRLPENLLPIMNDGAGNLYCLDMGSTGEPRVVFWDHTGGASQHPEEKGETFAIWLNGLLDGL